MNPLQSQRRFTRFSVLSACLILAGALLLLTWHGLHRTPQPGSNQSETVTPAAATTNQPAQIASTPVPVSAAQRVAATAATTPGGTQLPERPLPVALETPNFQWTTADGKDTNVIRQLAHNDLEYQRMVEENGRIKRRQLVYSKNTAAAVMQRSRLNGEAVTQLTLPGFDGQELQFAIERADLEPSKQVGTFAGQLVNRPNSLVTLAFKFGREAFTVISPEDGTFLQGHPREPGQIIITSFDPDTYMPQPGGEPIRTTEK